MRTPVLLAFALLLAPFSVACNNVDEPDDEATEDVGVAEQASTQSDDCDDDDDDAASPQPFQVDFTNCLESIGVGLVPTDAAQALTPPGYILVGTGTPVTPIVVRTAHCKISIDGGTAKERSIVQIGAVIVPPDFTGDINNYTYWYYTDDKKLAEHLNDAGVSAKRVSHIDYDFNKKKASGPNFHVHVPGSGGLSVDGRVTPSVVPAGTFDANWWQTSFSSSVKMATDVPVIDIGSADLVLTTNASSSLGDLIGGDSIGFPIIQQFNTFATAHMDVTLMP